MLADDSKRPHELPTEQGIKISPLLPAPYSLLLTPYFQVSFKIYQGLRGKSA
jgi:hypothetical protein